MGKPSGHYIPDVLPIHGPETAETRKDCMALRGFLPSLGCPGVESGVGSGFRSALPFHFQPLHPRLLLSGWVLTCGQSPLSHFFLRARDQGQAPGDRNLSRLWGRGEREQQVVKGDT